MASSLSALASRRPSGLNATDLEIRPPRGRPMVWALPGFHNRARWPALASRCPSGLNATDRTQSVWRVRDPPTDRPLARSHSRSDLSPPALARRSPSALNDTAETDFGAVESPCALRIRMH